MRRNKEKNKTVWQILQNLHSAKNGNGQDIMKVWKTVDDLKESLNGDLDEEKREETTQKG